MATKATNREPKVRFQPYYDPAPLLRQLVLDTRPIIMEYPNTSIEIGASSRRIAEQLGVTDHTVRQWMRGAAKLTRRNADRMAVAIGLVPEMLWDDWNQ